MNFFLHHSSHSKIPVFSYLSPSTQFKSVSSDLKEISGRNADKSYRVIGEPLPLPTKDTLSTSTAAAVTKVDKFFSFLNKPSKNAEAKKERKKGKSISVENGSKQHRKKKSAPPVPAQQASRLSQNSDSSGNNQPKLLPSKRIVQHHSYQNIIEEVSAEGQSNRTVQQQQQQPMRHFGDTNILRNKRDNNVTNQKSPQKTKPSPVLPSKSKDKKSSSVDSNFLLGSFDASSTDCSSSYCASKFFNIELKSPASVSKYKYSAGGSGASNLSAGSTISDSNSLDSMEHEIIHRKPTAGNGQAASGTEMSYLGPFNFRQLLRPTQGPTESLRKRRGINLSSTPPPIQKGKTKV